MKKNAINLKEIILAIVVIIIILFVSSHTISKNSNNQENDTTSNQNENNINVQGNNINEQQNMSKEEYQLYVTRYKEALEAVTKALELDYQKYNNFPGPFYVNSNDQGTGTYGTCIDHNRKILQNHMPVIDGKGKETFTTADGFIYSMHCGYFVVNLAGQDEICLAADENDKEREMTAFEPKCVCTLFDFQTPSTKLMPCNPSGEDMLSAEF